MRIAPFRWAGILLVAPMVATWRPCTAAEIPRDRYLHYLPLSHAKLMPQTAATAELQLYGDPTAASYRDADPVDGIDDGRHRTLLALAERFAPYLVQNTASIPVDFRRFIANRDTFALHVDTWDIGGNAPSLVRRDAVNLSALGREWDGAADAGPAPDDCKMIELLSAFAPEAAPRAAQGGRVHTRPELFQVLFFDFPGDGPDSWKRVYKEEYDRTPPEHRNAYPHAFVHPFVSAAQDSTGRSLGLELVFQYWFFYPSNDGANNHEGDWEHINVVVAPRHRVGESLTPADLRAVLEQPWETNPAQAPVIRRVEYYFHHFVMTLDYAHPNVYLPRPDWKAELQNRPQARLLESDIWKAIRQMAYVDDAETQVNTHAFGYIGADNKGIDQIMVAPGGNNRDSHGTYPFSGRYHDIGAAGATEQVSAHVDPREYLRAAARGKQGPGPEFEHGRVLRLSDAARLTIVPDWERVAALARTDPAARRDWSWMLLPALWGYPASQSPLAGIVEFADTGNQAPVGPTFSGGWNASGPARTFAAYEPHSLPSVFPLGLQDSFRNDLGWANATYPVLLNLPPLDFASRIVAYPFRELLKRQDPVFYPKDGFPYRFVGLSSGVSYMSFDKDFGTLVVNAQQLDSFILNALLHLATNGVDSTTVATGNRTFQDAAVSPFFDMSFYVGSHFVSQNLVRNARSAFGLTAQFNNIPPFEYTADANLWEYAGSIRYNLATGRWQPYAKAGYGWTWTRVENAQVGGTPLVPAESDWISPGFWPNTWHLGGGLELAPWKRAGGFPRGAELSLRVEYALYAQRLGLDLSNVELSELQLLFRTLGEVPGGETVRRQAVIVGATLSF